MKKKKLAQGRENIKEVGRDGEPSGMDCCRR
jgi:hypothetical protein